MARVTKPTPVRKGRSAQRTPRKPVQKPAAPSTKRKSAARTQRAAGSAPRQRPIELFYWPTPNGWKISIMLEECRLPYAVRPVNIAVGEQFKPDFLAVAPNNRMPAIVDPQDTRGRPISVFESSAILLYFGRKT
jgi:hypothetical protein